MAGKVALAVSKRSPRATRGPLPGDNLGAPYSTFLEQLEWVRAGLAATSIETFERATHLTVRRITDVAGISAGTYSRRRQGGRLSSAESERMFRLSRTFERAVDLFFGDRAGAVQWLETPIPALGDQRPLDLARTEAGAREVEHLITRIQHGVVS